MYIVKVLKRRDAASVIIAIVLAMIVMQVLQSSTFDLANRITSTNEFTGGGPGWKTMYLQPIVSAAIQLVVLEIGLRIAIALRSKLVRRAR
ncbi:hypothetical protein H0V99_00180 [Candidatus Saccharibacteria bacterium]|nr:hypothetical protein [Candidatus Saccharibacteria bacterium]